MDLKNLLNQALNSDLIKQGQHQLKQQSHSGSLKTLGAGAVGGGLISLLMGSKKSRKLSKKVAKSTLKVGGAAALGALAYKVYNDWQAQQSNPKKPNEFAANEELHNELILKAMIAAAKADGHVDQQEMAHIESSIQQSGANASLQALVHSELSKPLDPNDIAKLANSPQQAAEIYLASLLIADEQNFMEKAYLNELAKQLNLAPELVVELEQQLSN